MKRIIKLFFVFFMLISFFISSCVTVVNVKPKRKRRKKIIIVKPKRPRKPKKIIIH
ncbi:MAG: hypothetical protein KAT05_08175 [Spirochaetes bacterium]|nr:hypothetical protein [Spirochaetota bacterium]